MGTVYLNRDDLQKVQSILDSFPEVTRFTLEEHSQSGIGSLVDLTFETITNGVKGKMTVPIVDESSW